MTIICVRLIEKPDLSNPTYPTYREVRLIRIPTYRELTVYIYIYIYIYITTRVILEAK